MGLKRHETLDHSGPEPAGRATGIAAFVVAFPTPWAVSLAELGGRLGRGALADRGIVDAEISSDHARLEQRGGRVWLFDGGSRNGTFIDGRRLAQDESVALVDGTLVRLGRTIFVYREALLGPLEPSKPLGRLVGPFGLREVARSFMATLRAPTPNVLLEGETGTGKELLAQALADALRPGRPYAAVNVAGIAAGVFESQLFGHVAGAFSDARSASQGIVLAHAGGTVFLDEIGSLPLELQAKLLRLLDQREVLPVGATRPVTVDVALLAATNGGLEQSVDEGRFRADLLARLATTRFEIPPLRERAEDLFPIADVLAARYGLELTSSQVEVEAAERMLLHAWPRNVRELESTLRRSAVLDPRPGLRLWAVQQVLGEQPASRVGLLSSAAVEAALDAEGGNETAAARRLGVTRGRLRRFLAGRGPSSRETPRGSV